MHIPVYKERKRKYDTLQDRFNVKHEKSMTLQMDNTRRLTRGLAIFCLLYNLHLVNGLIGYDCNGATLNITTVSLLEVGDCNIPQPEVDEIPVFIQLLQINQYTAINVMQCKVEIYRVIRRCGMWSHGMDVPNGEYSYISPVSRDACADLFKYGRIKIGQTEVDGIYPNYTTHRPVSIAGSISQNSECEGVHYSDPYGNWEKVYVQGTVKISLRNYRADVDVDTNKVHLKSGMKCDLNEGRCADIDGGDTYWEPYPTDSCHTKQYGVLYEGPAKRTTDRDMQFKQTMYSMTEGDVIFALTAKDHTPVCGYSLMRTEHPKLLIVETAEGRPFIQKEAITARNLDLFAYVNSKFVYVEKYIRTQMKQMYQDILMQQCNLEKQVLENTIGLAKQTPDEFAYNVMKGPGYMAVLAGEVAHIVKCIPREVRVRETKECYNHLPVEVDNTTFHLTPRTHILKRTGVQVTCSNLVPSMYKIGKEWYSLEPRPVQALPPTILLPLTEQTWIYRNPQSLATSGIYTQKDLDSLRDHIMFPAERPAILNSVARGIAGQPTITQGGTIANLIDEQAIDKIIHSSWEKSWGYFSTFGTISAGLIGIVIIIRGIKLVIDTLIHGYALHTVYGWSIYLIGAIWDSVTNLLLHLGRRVNKTKKDDDNDDVESGKNSLTQGCPNGTATLGNKFYGGATEPLQFGFDPRINELQRLLSIEAARHTYQVPVRTYPQESLPTHFNPIYQPTVEPSSGNYVWVKGENTGKVEEVYKTAPSIVKPYPAPVDNEKPKDKETTENNQEKAPSPSAIVEPEINKNPETSSKIVPVTLYPTLEKIKRASVLTPVPEKKIYFSLDRRANK